MLRTDDPKLLNALIRLQSYSEWEIIRKWIEDSITKNYELSCNEVDNVHSRWLQGGAKELSKLLHCVDNAKNVAEEMRKTQ